MFPSDITHFVFEAAATIFYNILWYRLMTRFVGWRGRGHGCLRLVGVPLYWGADKSLARQGKEQTTATKL